MLKKWVSLCLLFVMLMPVAVFAEEVTAFIHETDPYYTYVAPEGWMLISEDNLDAILQLGGNLINDDQIMAYIEQAKAADMAMFMAPNMSDNINITYQYLGQEGTAEELAMYLAPALVEQFKSMFADMEVENEGSVITLAITRS